MENVNDLECLIYKQRSLLVLKRNVFVGGKGHVGLQVLGNVSLRAAMVIEVLIKPQIDVKAQWGIWELGV